MDLHSLLLGLSEAEALVLLTATGILLVHAVWLRWYGKWSQPRLARARAALSAALEGLTLSAQDLEIPRALPHRLQIRLFVDIAHSLGGESRQQLAEVAAQLGMVAQAEARCRSRLWWRRLDGARLLTLLRTGENVMPALLGDRHPAVRAQAAEWAASYPTPEVIAALLRLLGEGEAMARFSIQDSLLQIGAPVVEPLVEYLSMHQGPTVEDALKVAVGLADARLLPPALALCHDSSPRVRALAATLIGALGGSEGVAVLVDLLADPVPAVRSAACRSLGKLSHWPAASALAGLLRDSSWIVRREAGFALRALGAPGILFLRRSLSDSDPFAADMARQVLDLPTASGWAMPL